MLQWLGEVSAYHSFESSKVLRTPDGKWHQEAGEKAREDICFFM